MWKTFIENQVNKELHALANGNETALALNPLRPGLDYDEDTAFFQLPPEFPLSTLAHISEGYSAGSIKKTCENVLTDFRKTKLEVRPLALSEFIGPLSLCGCTDQEANDSLKKFTDQITGDKARRTKLEKALDTEDDKKGKGKTAKKKKK